MLIASVYSNTPVGLCSPAHGGENDLQWNHKLNSGTASPSAADCWESEVFREAAAKPVQSRAATREAEGNLELF